MSLKYNVEELNLKWYNLTNNSSVRRLYESGKASRIL